MKTKIQEISEIGQALCFIGIIVCGLASLITCAVNLPPKLLPGGRIAVALEARFLIAMGICFLVFVIFNMLCEPVNAEQKSDE